MSPSLRRLDLADAIISIYFLVFALVILPISLYVAFRGIRAPRLSALLSTVSICFIFAYSLEWINVYAYYIGLVAIPIVAGVIFFVQDISPILVAASLPLHAIYTLYIMFLVQTVTEPNGFIQFDVPSPTSWIVVTAVAILLAIATGFFMRFADPEPQRHLFIAASSTTGVFFAVHYVGAIFATRVVTSYSDYFKMFALRPWICWPVALVLTALAAWTQLRTKVPEPPATESEGKPLVAQA
ncbi:Aste57867_12102 [Aphanomyces stellatus]|uniref:Aste57867_12102 protein n=1 Tax=Aphanomyces stellatus TaxID=120398 RepID=A0A485KWP7_9STRA|nr:hypothetical protein As57867_012057 [Aphanomyces stellatus]VFT88957.1 Aste57867_12102 [Aphanomyces stellatus]